MSNEESKRTNGLVNGLALVGAVSMVCMGSVVVGFHRVHIENLKTRTVWIFNAPSEENTSLSKENVECLVKNQCKLLEDGTVIVK